MPHFQSVLIKYKINAEHSVVVWVFIMEDVKVKIGELFENFYHLNKKHRVKTNHEVQEFVAERFKQITGFSVSNRLFHSVCQTF